MPTALRSTTFRPTGLRRLTGSRRGRAALVTVALVAPSIVGVAALASPAAASVGPIDVYIGDRGVVEGDGGPTTPANFPVELSAPAATDTFVWFHTTDGSASADDGDYTARPAGKLKIAAGKTVGTIAVAVIGDTKVEPDETFSVVIDKVTITPKGAADLAYSLARTVGTGTIIDDDSGPTTPTLSIGSAAIPEGNAGTAKKVVGLHLSKPTTTAEYVYFSTEGESATSGQDFVAKSVKSRVTIPAGKTEAVIPITAIADRDNEGDETYRVVIDRVTTQVGGAQDPAITIGRGTAEITIIDDDVPATAPGTPGPVHADWAPSHNGDAIVTWTAPSVTGGRVPTYLVEYSNDFGENWISAGSVATTTTTVPCRGTFEGVFYCTFRVTAHTSGGDSVPSYMSGNLFFCFDISCLI